jgi:hypothetical protein
MTTERNQPIPSGKCTPIPANTEAIREHAARNREWLERMHAIMAGGHPRERHSFQGRRSGQLFAGVWGSSRMLSGNQRLESKRKRLSVNKGTGEARSSRVVAWIGCLRTVESLPMRRPSGGAPVVVRGRESRPHGKGAQDVSFWITERFTIGRVSNER